MVTLGDHGARLTPEVPTWVATLLEELSGLVAGAGG